MLFRFKLYNQDYYCHKCLEIVKRKDIEEEKKRKLEEEKKKEKEKKKQIENAIIKNKIADKKLREDLRNQKLKEEEKRKMEEEKLRLKLIKREKKEETVEKVKKYSPKFIFDGIEIAQNENLLYIKANVKKLLVLEWVKGKKRIVINKEREIRRTHAGGFSAEKFQKFVDFKKKKTFEWIDGNLEKPGILRTNYDMIKIEAKPEELKKELEKYLKKYEK